MSRSPRFIALLVTRRLRFSRLRRPRGGPCLKTPYDLYELGPAGRGPELESVRGRSAGDWRVLHQAAHPWSHLAVSWGFEEGKSLSEVPGAGRPGYLGRVREGERVHPRRPRGNAPGSASRGTRVAPFQIAPSGFDRIHHLPETPDRLPRRKRIIPSVSSSGCSLRQSRATPHPGGALPAGIVQRAMESGKAGTRTAEEVEAVRDRVSADSLEASSARSPNFPAEEAQSVFRPSRDRDGFSAVDRDATRGGARSREGQFAAVRSDHGDTTLTVTNVIGNLRCGIPNAGAILVTAHYDAIGLAAIRASSAPRAIACRARAAIAANRTR